MDSYFEGFNIIEQLYDHRMKLEIEGWILDIDVQRTKKTYASIRESGCLACGCNYCLNYLKNLPESFPINIRKFFESAGMDISKDAEVYEQGEVTPTRNLYEGEYYLWGSIISVPENKPSRIDKVEFEFIKPTPLGQEELKGAGALCFSFNTELEWILN